MGGPRRRAPAVCTNIRNGHRFAGRVRVPHAASVIEAAPGQVMIVSLNGAKARLTGPVPGVPAYPKLGRTVAGFSAQLVQARGRTPFWIFGVAQSDCVAAPCAPVTNTPLLI